MKKRNVIVAALLAVAVVGASIGGYYGFRAMNRPVTMVYAVSDLSSGYWGDNMTLDGMITSDASQNIYLSTEQKVKEVLVQEGDTVREGDVLMSYDTTAKELELETMELDQKQNELKLDQAKKQLKQLEEYDKRALPEDALPLCNRQDGSVPDIVRLPRVNEGDVWREAAEHENHAVGISRHEHEAAQKGEDNRAGVGRKAQLLIQQSHPAPSFPCAA